MTRTPAPNVQAIVQKTTLAIRSHGGRVTSSRIAVIKAIAEADGHVSAEELFEHIHGQNPDVHISTVYRTLEALESLGVVEHVHLGHGRAVYHLEENVHQHLVCEQCGAVIEAPKDLSERLQLELEARMGFHTKAHHFSIIGVCRECYARSN